MVYNFLYLQFTNVHNRLECLSLASLSRLVKCLWVRPEGFTQAGSGLTHNHFTKLQKTDSLSQGVNFIK